MLIQLIESVLDIREHTDEFPSIYSLHILYLVLSLKLTFVKPAETLWHCHALAESLHLRMILIMKNSKKYFSETSIIAIY